MTFYLCIVRKVRNELTLLQERYKFAETPHSGIQQFFDIPEYTFDFCPSYLTDVPLAG